MVEEDTRKSVSHVHTGKITGNTILKLFTASRSQIFDNKTSPRGKSRYIVDSIKPFSYQKKIEDSSNLTNLVEESSVTHEVIPIVIFLEV